MKKLFSVVVMFLFVFTLSACNDETEDPKVQDPIDEVNQWEVTVQIGENEFVHSLPEDYEGTLFDVIDDSYDLEYSSSEYGIFILSLEDLTPKNGQYIMIGENDEMASAGIDQLTLEDGDVFRFSLVWYDQVLQEIDEMISLFLENHVDQYISDSFIDVNVLSALRLLGVEEQYVGDLNVPEMDMVNQSLLVSTSDYFKAIMLMNSLGYDISGLLADYTEQATTGFYGETAYGLLLLQMAEEKDVSALVTEFENDLQVNTPMILGLDAGGISLVALANSSFDGKQPLIDQYVAWIQSIQLDNGGIKTRDMVWGDTVYPGTENASSMAQVIIGLLANGIDPVGEGFVRGDASLMTRLLSFTTEDGAFDYLLDDDLDVDMMFSTPQAFLAIVMYQEYKATLGAVHPYHVE